MLGAGALICRDVAVSEMVNDWLINLQAGGQTNGAAVVDGWSSTEALADIVACVGMIRMDVRDSCAKIAGLVCGDARGNTHDILVVTGAEMDGKRLRVQVNSYCTSVFPY